MNKKELAKKLNEVEDLGSVAKAEKVIDSMMDIVLETAKTEKVDFRGLSFDKIERAARKGRNPQTGEEIQIPAKTEIKVKLNKTAKTI